MFPEAKRLSLFMKDVKKKMYFPLSPLYARGWFNEVYRTRMQLYSGILHSFMPQMPADTCVFVKS